MGSPSYPARLVAAVAALVLLPWFWLTEAVVPLEPVPPSLEATDAEFLAFYVENVARLPLSATLFVGQWVIVQVLVLSVIWAAHARLGLTAFLAATLTTAATAIYAGAEGVRVWPVLAANMSPEVLNDHLDPGLARSAVLSRDGLHAPASVLLGLALLLTAWLLVTSALWGRWVMSGLAVAAGGLALSSILVGPEGLGPGLIFVLWGPVTAVCLLVGLRREPPAPSAPTEAETGAPGPKLDRLA
jgi:hypothetical protein